VTPSLDDLTTRLRDSHVSWVSAGLVSGIDGSADYRAACQVRDPDGHAVVIGQSGVERQAAHP
jgi:hypothetical protein